MNRTILLADDSSTIRKIVELTFQDSGITVEAVAGGAEALERLGEVQPDLLLADVVMPEPAGYELCRQVKGSSRPIPVVLLTGAFEAFDTERARECGADDRLVKPFESRLLRETVERLLSASAVPGAEARTETAVVEDSEELDELSAEVEQSRPGQDAGEAYGDPYREPYDHVPTPEVEARPEAEATRLSAADIEAVADAVVRRLSGDVVRELAREMLPEIARTLVAQRIRELEDDDD